MHLGSLLVVHGLERGVAAVGRGLAGGDVECLGPKLSQLERFDGGCADYDPDAVGAALRRRRAGAAVLYRGDACRTKGWVKHDFAGQIAANHRAELWEPLRRAFGFVELYGHVSGPPACVAAMRGTANWTRLDAIETSTEHYSSKKWFNAGHDWFRNVTNGAAGFVVVARPDIVFRRPVDAFLDAGRLNLFHFEDVRFGRACGAQARACFETGCHWMNSDALFAAPGQIYYPLSGLSRSTGHDLVDFARACCGGAHVPAAKFVTVLETEACHNTRAFDWQPYYYIYGMLFCEAEIRPGETAGETCLSLTRTAMTDFYYPANATNGTARR